MKVILENLSKHYPNMDKKKKDKVIALDNFSLEIPDGKLVALLGPSGCGKSTTLNLLSGLQDPTSGKIIFGDNDVTNIPAEKRGVGLVFQNYALYPHLTVLQNIMFPLENLKGTEKLSKEVMKQKAIEASKLVQIDMLLERKPSELSGGQQQRVAIARALVKMPKILLLDEPLSNLDARLRLQTREEIRRIQKETNITTIFVTHDQEEAMSISDLIVVLKSGVMQQVGKPQEIYDNPKNLFVAKFLGTPAINVFKGCVKDEMIYIGSEAVGKAKGVNDKEVYVTIRPEGFIVNEKGTFTCNLSTVEVMGRERSIVSTHPDCLSGNIRSIISSDIKVETTEFVKFDIKEHKIFIFDAQSEERIYC